MGKTKFNNIIDFERFCRDAGLAVSPPKHKHSRSGWVQTECPFCTGNVGYHLGYNKMFAYFNCWRCGYHTIKEVFSEFIGNIGYSSWWKAYQHYSAGEIPDSVLESTEKIQKARKTILPEGCRPMKKVHRKYLERRNFDPLELERDWKIEGTSCYGNYSYRVIIPIFFQNKLVSYQGRDYTGRQELRYKACKKSDEVVDHKHTLYGIDKVPSDTIVIVEGAIDVWRLGYGAVATYGIEYTKEQVALASIFKKKYVMFDSTDPQAKVQADKLASELSMLGGETNIIKLSGGDPADMKPSEAGAMMRSLM